MTDSSERPATPERPAPPQRPSLVSDNAPPVLAKLTPPFSIRMCQLLWILSFVVGAFCIVYFFIIRKAQLPLIADIVREVEPSRDEQTYTVAADIIYWSIFGILVAVLLVQITLLVSFMSRRPNIRWWQLLTLCLLFLIFALALDTVLRGEQAQPLRYLLPAQCGLVALALLASVLPGAIAWSARQRDVVRRDAGGGADFGG